MRLFWANNTKVTPLGNFVWEKVCEARGDFTPQSVTFGQSFVPPPPLPLYGHFPKKCLPKYDVFKGKNNCFLSKS